MSVSAAMAEYRVWERELRNAEEAYDDENRICDGGEYERIQEATGEKLIAAENLIEAMLIGLEDLFKSVDAKHSLDIDKLGMFDYDAAVTDYNEDIAERAEHFCGMFPHVRHSQP